MLTKHKYSPPQTDITNPDNAIFKCCRKEVPEDPTCTDCCYDTWKDELKQVNVKYSQAEEKAAQTKKRFDFEAERSGRYKRWLDELEKAEEITGKICYQLEIIAGQTEKIWYNSIKAVDAIELLFCMIRDFYSQVDYLKKRYDELQNCITVNTDPSLEKDKGILKCLTDYYKRLDDVIKTRDEIIKALIEAIKLSNLIRNNMSTQDCPEGYRPCDENRKPCNCGSNGGAVYYGFKTIICEWFCAFGCDEDCIPWEQAANQRPPEKHEQQNPNEIRICSNHCELVPVFDLPICNNPYKWELKRCYEKAAEAVKKCEEELKDANKDKEALAACKLGLEKAIAEVNPKARC